MNPNESNAFRAIYQMEEFRKELEEFAKKYEASEKLIDYKEDLERLQNRIRNCWKWKHVSQTISYNKKVKIPIDVL